MIYVAHFHNKLYERTKQMTRHISSSFWKQKTQQQKSTKNTQNNNTLIIAQLRHLQYFN